MPKKDKRESDSTFLFIIVDKGDNRLLIPSDGVGKCSFLFPIVYEGGSRSLILIVGERETSFLSVILEGGSRFQFRIVHKR